MKLITLTEYCMFIFFAGVYLAITGFTARDLGLYIGIAMIYVFVHIAAKRMLSKRGKEAAEIRILYSVLLDYGLCVRYRTVYRSAGIIIRIKSTKMPDCPNGHQAFFSLFFGFR